MKSDEIFNGLADTMKGPTRDRAVIDRYISANRRKTLAFQMLDRMLSVYFGTPKLAAQQALAVPGRLLLADGAHLGDTILLSSLMPALRKLMPETEIGILTGSWNRELLDGFGQFDNIHYLDHWYLERSTKSKISAIVSYARCSEKVVRALKEQRYDVAINMRAWFPNFVPVLWRANIPIRIGFNRSGFVPMLTHYIPFAYDRRSVRSYYAQLLSSICVDRVELERATVPWMHSSAKARAEVRSIFSIPPSQQYAVLHVTASTPLKNWRRDGWKLIESDILRRGLIPVFTGSGIAQRVAIESIISEGGHSINACDKLSWQQLVAAVEQARIVISVDTSVGHLAAAVGVPCVSIYGGMQDPELWKPLGKRVSLVQNEIACNPCFNKNGCRDMSCLAEIAPSQVKAAIEALLG